jgi:hypothetical protein
MMWGSDFPHPDGVWPHSIRPVTRAELAILSSPGPLAEHLLVIRCWRLPQSGRACVRSTSSRRRFAKRSRDPIRAPSFRPPPARLSASSVIADCAVPHRQRRGCRRHRSSPSTRAVPRPSPFLDRPEFPSGKLYAAISRADAQADRMLDAICLAGPLPRCREQLPAFRAAGVDLPILSAPIGVDGAREVIPRFPPVNRPFSSQPARHGRAYQLVSARRAIAPSEPSAYPPSIL